jgi:hypothetical protein
MEYKWVHLAASNKLTGKSLGVVPLRALSPLFAVRGVHFMT